MIPSHRLEEFDIALIERVKLTPALYDPHDPEFRLTARKALHWDNVSSSLGLGAADARRRWTCLRDRYTRELKQLRLYPEKADLGDNDFFRLMDFLRSFVRKRRMRRRNTAKYESNWGEGSGSMDETTKMVVNKVRHSVGGADEELDEVSCSANETHEETPPHNYVKKMVGPQVEVVDYPEYVEAGSGGYDGHAEHQPVEVTTCGDSVNLKDSNHSITVMVPQEITTTYALSPHQSMPSGLQHQHHQQQQYEKQKRDHEGKQHHQIVHHHQPSSACAVAEPNLNETEDDYFCKSVAAYLRQLSRRHKIKAKVEMFQILEKYIELEENEQKH